MEEAENRFLLSTSRLARGTRKNYERIIDRFREYAPPKINQVATEHIEGFLLALQGKKCRASTLNEYLTGIKVFYNWLEREHDLKNIAKKVRYFQTVPPRRRFISKEEYTKLIEANSGYVKDCIVFLANSGLRASEFVNLKPSDIKGQFIEVVGKGGKFRKIPLNATLKSLIASNPHLEFSKSNNRNWLNRLCSKASKTAGIEPFSPHCLRRFFASQLYHKKISLLILSRLLGHSTVGQTEAYLGLQDSELLGSTDVLD